MVKTQEFVQKSNALHNNKYDYNKTDYKNSYTKVEIVCKYHGVFTQRPKDHLRSGGLHAGCPKCGDDKAACSRTKSTDYFLEKARSIHGDKFDYSRVNYKHTHKNVKIICKKHSLEFEVTPSNFFGNIHNCPECFREINSRLDFTTEEFIENCRKIHGNLYDYSKTQYTGIFNKIIVICEKHGEFLQSAHAHSNKAQGCPNCSTSKGELSVKLYLEENNIKFEQQKTFDGCVYKGLLKFDFYLPDNNICIEFQGRQHFECVDYFGGEDGFSETKIRDKIKQDFCRSNQINLICIKDGDILDVALRKPQCR